MFTFVSVACIDRIAAFTLRISDSGHIPEDEFYYKMGNDLPIYCFSIVTFALWLQWHYLYCVLDDFNAALELLDRKMHSKVLVVVLMFSALLWILEIVFCWSDYIKPDNENLRTAYIVFEIILSIVSSAVFILYICLYNAFVNLMKRDNSE